MSGLVTTYQMRLPRGPHEDVLGAAAAHLCGVERHLHSALARLHRASTTRAPSWKLSATIRAFNSSGQRRLPRRGSTTSTRPACKLPSAITSSKKH